MERQEKILLMNECSRKILDTLSDAQMSKELCMHTLGLACVQILSSYEDQKKASDILKEMIEVVCKTMNALNLAEEELSDCDVTQH